MQLGPWDKVPCASLVRQILPNIMAPIAVTIDAGLCSGHQCGSVPQLPRTWVVRPLHQLGHDDPGRPRLLEVAPWLAIFPGLTLAGVILAFTLVGDALRDQLDPRMRRS